jgi:hypothetical protein
MPEVVRGSRASFQVDRPQHGSLDGLTPSSPVRETRNVHFGPESPDLNREETPTPGLRAVDTGLSTMSGTERRKSREQVRKERKAEPERDAYYDSRAATKREFRRRASTLQEYYTQNPTLLPQLPFTMRHGWKRWKLFFTIFLIIVDACVIPIVLYYTMKFIGHVEGWISKSLSRRLSRPPADYRCAQFSQLLLPSGVDQPTSSSQYEAGDFGRKRTSSDPSVLITSGLSTLRTGSPC